MSVFENSGSVSTRGKKDARRHREKQREALKKNLPAIIAEESIITARRGKKVKIPIRSLQIPHFRPKQSKEGGQYGVGQGKGNPGDIIGGKKLPGKGQGAGDAPGEEYLESEVELEEIIALMLEDLGLPNLEEKSARKIAVEFGWRIKGQGPKGPPPLINRKESAKMGLRRFYAYLSLLEKETHRDKETCHAALRKADGLLNTARELLQDPAFQADVDTEVTPFPIYEADDLRYRKIQQDYKEVSQAVIIAMMDVSGSMWNEKKYYARSMLFWLVQFLRKLYQNVDIRFIIHTADAKLVDEDSFFRTEESGGTVCSTAYELGNTLIDNEYPTSEWNVYMFHFSDGEDWAPHESLQVMQESMRRGIAMLGYCQINPDSHLASGNDLLRAIETNFPVSVSQREGVRVIEGAKHFPFLGMVVRERKHLWIALQAFLAKERWENG